MITTTAVNATPHVIYVVDDDDGVRKSLVRLLQSADYTVRAYASGTELLAEPLAMDAGCLILDMNMPQCDGLDIVAALTQRGALLPVIILTGFGSIPMTVTAMRAGVCEFLTKPVDTDVLLAAIELALKKNAAVYQERQSLADLTARHRSLTPRENEVFLFVVAGLLNKQIAARMGISEITAKVHRRSVMEKMRANSAAELGRYAEQLNLRHVE